MAVMIMPRIRARRENSRICMLGGTNGWCFFLPPRDGETVVISALIGTPRGQLRCKPGKTAHSSMAGCAYTRADITPSVPALKPPESRLPKGGALWCALDEGKSHGSGWGRGVRSASSLLTQKHR